LNRRDLAHEIEQHGRMTWVQNGGQNFYLHTDDLTARNIKGLVGVGSVRQMRKKWRWLTSSAADIRAILAETLQYMSDEGRGIWQEEIDALAATLESESPGYRVPKTSFGAMSQTAPDPKELTKAQKLIKKQLKRAKPPVINSREMRVRSTPSNAALLEKLFGGEIRQHRDSLSNDTYGEPEYLEGPATWRLRRVNEIKRAGE
jgi:hypothetical protein